ncbi:hypothetical protein VULLAG_LOCUS18421 [Vulpes lagopus]
MGACRTAGACRVGAGQSGGGPNAGSGPTRVGWEGLKGPARGSRTVRLPPPPSVRAQLSRGCAGRAAPETKRRRRRRRRVGPGPWPGRPGRRASLGCAERYLSTNYMPGPGIQAKKPCPCRVGKDDPDVETEAQRSLKLARGHTTWTLQS